MVSEYIKNMQNDKFLYSLNPCFSGGWSRSSATEALMDEWRDVLILVLVEDGLGAVINM